MNVAVEDLGTDTIVINLEGEMMLGYEANDFHEAVRGALDNKKKKIVVDLSNVKFISSWGIGILIYGYTTTINAGGQYKLAAVPPRVNEILKNVRLDTIFHQYETVQDALNSSI